MAISIAQDRKLKFKRFNALPKISQLREGRTRTGIPFGLTLEPRLLTFALCVV